MDCSSPIVSLSRFNAYRRAVTHFDSLEWPGRPAQRSTLFYHIFGFQRFSWVWPSSITTRFTRQSSNCFAEFPQRNDYGWLCQIGEKFCQQDRLDQALSTGYRLLPITVSSSPFSHFRSAKPSSRVMGNAYVNSRIKAASSGTFWSCSLHFFFFDSKLTPRRSFPFYSKGELPEVCSATRFRRDLLGSSEVNPKFRVTTKVNSQRIRPIKKSYKGWGKYKLVLLHWSLTRWATRWLQFLVNLSLRASASL